MAEAPIKTDLILRGKIAGRAVTFVGRLDGGTLAEVSGSVKLGVSLSAILEDLGADYGEAAKVLQQLVGSSDIVLEKLGAAYRSGPKPAQDGSLKGGSVQVGLVIKIGDNSVQFALLKGTGEQKGFIAGVDLRSNELKLPKNFLSGLIGDISIGNLGVYYASEEFKEVSFVGADAFQDASQFILEPSRIAPRPFPKGVKFSAEILVGGMNLLDQPAIQKAETTVSKEPETLTCAR